MPETQNATMPASAAPTPGSAALLNPALICPVCGEGPCLHQTPIGAVGWAGEVGRKGEATMMMMLFICSYRNKK
jgi:hypothetical protein